MMSVAYGDCQKRCRGTLTDSLGHGRRPEAAQDFEIFFGDQVTLINIEPAFAICHRYICVLGLLRREGNLQLTAQIVLPGTDAAPRFGRSQWKTGSCEWRIRPGAGGGRG